MKASKWNGFVYVHGILLLWALLFIGGLHIFGRNMPAFLGLGNFFYLFVNIPLAICTFVLISKDFITGAKKVPTAVLSVLNLIIGIIAWYFIILLIQKP